HAVIYLSFSERTAACRPRRERKKSDKNERVYQMSDRPKRPRRCPVRRGVSCQDESRTDRAFANDENQREKREFPFFFAFRKTPPCPRNKRPRRKYYHNDAGESRRHTVRKFDKCF